jgi:hypothetical protein
MIERPATAGIRVAPAVAGGTEAAQAAPAAFADVPLEAGRSVHAIAGIGPDPALEPPVSDVFAERPNARFAHTAARPGARSSTRAPKGTERMEYRAVFACCTEATDTPTE